MAIKITYIQTFENYTAPKVLNKETPYETHGAFQQLLIGALTVQNKRDKTKEYFLKTSGPANERSIVDRNSSLTVATYRWTNI